MSSACSPHLRARAKSPRRRCSRASQSSEPATSAWTGPRTWRSRASIFSATANYQVSAPFTLSGRYAAKWNVASDNVLSSSATTQMAAGRAMWDLTRRWDFGVSAGSIYNMKLGSRQYGLGAETGYRIMSNVWLSAGYNLAGFKDDDLTGEDITRRGAFIRMRFKFDENIFAPRDKSRQ